jgi:tetratricopeptide (TPR) repeat protein
MKMLTLTSAIAGLAISISPAFAQFEDVGVVDFATSTESAEAQAHFLRGVAMLHSFGWKQAIEQFQAAQELDPDFAMAYWGESLCYNHPLFSSQDPEKPREALGRLGASPEARADKAPSDREKGFLAAVEKLWGEGDNPTRRIAYMRAMEQLWERYPDDDEVAAFYALSLIAASGPLGDDDFRHKVRAGAIALDVFARHPDHPGAAHYAIHAFDDPVHAPIALPAAERYATIAPAVSHARHMPSHIFIQRGMWQRVTDSNISAYQAAHDLWEPGDSVGDMVHALDWGQYGDLQHGDYEHARHWITTIEKVIERSEGAARAKTTLPMMKARYLVETEDWDYADLEQTGTTYDAFATAYAALHRDRIGVARKAAKQLAAHAVEAAKATEFRARFAIKPAQIMTHEIDGLIALHKGREAEAVEHLARAVELADEMGAPSGAASPVKPAHELQGEVFLALERWDDAVESFEASLRLTPNRPLSLRGLARAHVGRGDVDGARQAYERLAEIWQGRDDPPGAGEARRYLAHGT